MLRWIRLLGYLIGLGLLVSGATSLARVGELAERRVRVDRAVLRAEILLVLELVEQGASTEAPFTLLQRDGEWVLAGDGGEQAWAPMGGMLQRQIGLQFHPGEPGGGDLMVTTHGLLGGALLWATPPRSAAVSWSAQLSSMLALIVVLLAILSADLLAYGWVRARKETVTRTREQLLGRISHELRTPATTVRSLAETLTQGGVTDEAERERYLEVVRHEAVRLAEGIDRLLRAARGVAPANLNWADVDLADWLRQQMDRRQKDIQFDAPASLTSRVDIGRLTEALDALLDNAARHGKPPISVRLYRQGRWAMLTVEDAGPGVPPSQRKRVFQEGVRGNSAGGGFGLGLWVVDQVARAHGGSVRLVGECHFQIRLPISPRRG